MERIILVRHGYPDHMDSGLTGGWTDSHLTELGRWQARSTAPQVAKLVGDRPFGFYSSDLSRALETAEYIADALQTEPQPVKALREQDLGEANGLTTGAAADIALDQQGGPIVDRIFFPAAETWRRMMDRVFRWLETLRDGDKTIVLVSHAGASTCVVYWWLMLEADRWPGIQFEFDLCSITELIRGEHGGRRVLRLNDTRHLGSLRR